MFQPLFAYTADPHLQEGAWANRPEIAGDSYRSFHQIIQYCVTNRLSLVLGGDIFDKRSPPATAVNTFLYGADTLAHAGQTIYFVQGDHCFSAALPWPLLAPHGVKHLPAIADGVTIGGMLIRGIDWTPTHELKAKLDTVPECHILVTHQAWAEVQRIGATEGSLNDIRFPCVVLSGDYHQPVRMVHKQIKFYSAGSTCMQAIDEMPDKSFLVVGLEDGMPSVQVIPLLTRPCYRMRINQVADLNDVTRIVESLVQAQMSVAANLRIAPADTKPLLRVTYHETVPGVKSTIENLCGDRLHLFWDPKATVDNVVVDYDAMSSGRAFDGLLAAVNTLEPNATDVTSGLERLLCTGNDLAAELDAMKLEATQLANGS